MPTAASGPAAATRARLMGAYYTPTTTADLMANWILRHDGDRVLEPSFGEGAFIRAVSQAVAHRNLRNVEVCGVEIDAEAHERAVSTNLLSHGNAVLSDFLQVQPFLVDAVIGNPPYVRIRHIEHAATRGRALAVARATLPDGMEPSGSIWMPFVLHATRFLRIGGRMALVLPYDFTYVRYARPLWKFLAERFAFLRVARVHKRVFPDILQDVALLFADGHGGHTSTVKFDAFSTLADLLDGAAAATAEVSVRSIVEGERQFVEALLSPDLRTLLRGKLTELTRPARELANLNIGYVSGDKKFFHPDERTIREYELPERSLEAALASSRDLRCAGLFTSSLPKNDRLFLPPASDLNSLTSGERRYILDGEKAMVNQRFKCRVRSPWYRVPYVKRPDFVLSVFSSTPLLVINDVGIVASNSLLCGYSLGVSPELFAARWYSSLTLLECELRVHSLGGGVLIMVPREAGSIRLPEISSTDNLDVADDCLRRGELAAAYFARDSAVLRAGMGLSVGEIDLIREGIESLRFWRERSVNRTDHSEGIR